MIFVGDVAVAPGDRFSFERVPAGFRNAAQCFNLEGAVYALSSPPAWGTCSWEGWAASFSEFHLVVAFIGNNHIQDVAGGIGRSMSKLSKMGISAVGAGANAREAARNVEAKYREQKYVVLGCGWLVVGCQSVGECAPKVNPLEGRAVRRQVIEALRQDNQEARVVVVMHGNYEFEFYAQPAHSKLAMALIDLGAYAVVGRHSHVVGPVEQCKGRTIAYSLGNWAFSYGRFVGGRLRFPESSFHQIALEPGAACDTVHHARFHPSSTVRYESSESVGCNEFSLRPEFAGYSHEEYCRWLRRNRVKRLALPICRDADASRANRLRDAWVAARQVVVDQLARTGVKRMRRGG